MEIYKVLVIGPFPIILMGLERILEKEDGLVVSGMADDYSRAMQLVKASDSDIIVAAIFPGFWKNARVIKDIRSERIDTPLLVCSGCNDYNYAKSCLEAGANGYFLIDEPAENMAKAIRSVLSGQGYFSDGITKTERVIDDYNIPIRSLTERELEVFMYMGQGVGNEKIAKILDISVGTVKTHKRNVLRKSGLKGMGELDEYVVQYALRKARGYRS